jgi:cytochrome c-type biogenesis protein CcmH
MRRASRLAGAMLLGAFLRLPAALAAPVTDEAVTVVASQLRCVVCQNLSVADSPSEMARQMRDVIRERLAAGQAPEQVIAYFVDKYGDWVLLAPPARGFNLLVWGLPGVVLLGGVVIVLRVTRRWSHRPPPSLETLDPADRERVRRELERLGPGE